MTLSRVQILNACNNYNLVEPFKESKIQTCSYDLTFSGEYQMYTTKNKGGIIKLTEGEKLIIPADAICFVLTTETVNIPHHLTAHISLSLSLIKSGVMMAAQPPYDAGYSGKTLALLHNLSNKPVEITVGQHILNIVFEQLTNAVESNYLYGNRNGKYHKADSLEKFKISPKVKGGVFDLAESLRKQKRQVQNSIPTILTVITVILGLITLFISISGVANIFGSTQKEDSSVKISSDSVKVISSPTEKNEMVIVYNDEVYWIDFENLQVSKCE